jgi:hypothetical protein
MTSQQSPASEPRYSTSYLRSTIIYKHASRLSKGPGASSTLNAHVDDLPMQRLPSCLWLSLSSGRYQWRSSPMAVAHRWSHPTSTAMPRPRMHLHVGKRGARWRRMAHLKLCSNEPWCVEGNIHDLCVALADVHEGDADRSLANSSKCMVLKIR